MKQVVSAAAIAAAASAALNNKISPSSLSIINSDTLPGNLLPNFLFQQGSIEGGSIGLKIGGGRGTPRVFTPDDTCLDDIFEGAMMDTRSPQLPYLTQDQWTCDRKVEDMSVWNFENDDLLVTITPQFAGKVWGIYDKKRQRDLLFNNRAHQPANIGALKAWASGGAEWNWSPGIIGHSAFSETQTYLTTVDTEEGPMARVYEFDRYNGTVWQVDMLIVNDTFVAHPRITNPTDVDLRGYWWTCVAVDATPETRIFAPATRVAETSREPMRDAPWPYFAEAIENSTFQGYNGEWPTDNSWLANHQLGDMFLRIPDTVYSPYIAHTETDGYVLVHGHPLNGTKFFTWGDQGPGRFMQDFLAGGGKRQGDYTELQVGPAPTQMQNFPVPKNSIREWTEWFKGFDGKTDVLRGKDYNAALDHIDQWMRSPNGMPKEEVNKWDAFFQKHATKAPSQILVRGQPWGALEEMLLGHKLVEGLEFSLPKEGEEGYEEAVAWIELLTQGTFSERTLSLLPVSYQTTDRWFKRIIESAEKHGMTWLHALHIGVGYGERGATETAIKYFQLSMDLKPNPIAIRCIGVMQTTMEAAFALIKQGYEMIPQWPNKNDPSISRLYRNFVTEISFLLIQENWMPEMEAFYAVVPEAYRHLDGFLTLEIKVLLYRQEFEHAASVLGSNCFPTFAKARDNLMKMWNQAQEGIAQQKKGSTPLTYVEKHRARVDHPIPDNIGCQYASEFCANYW
jgi:hypothetical protein